MTEERLSKRASFDTVAGLYDRRRPAPPAVAFDELVRRGGLTTGSQVLEVGCGTGSGTVELAKRGLNVVAVELGESLASVARRNLAEFANVDIVTADFERWHPRGQQFDALVAIGAWHWIDPDHRTTKAADLLRDGGTLAIIGGGHAAGPDSDLFDQIQRCYERHDPATPPGFRLPDPDTMPPNDWGLTRSPAFETPTYYRCVTDHEYLTDEYLELIGTFSGTIALPPDNRAALFDCIAQLIETSGGRIRRTELTELCTASRTSRKEPRS